MTWCHDLFRCTAAFLFLVAGIAVPPGYSQGSSPRITASIGVIDPPLERADRALHPEIEVSFPLTEFGSGKSSSVALSAGRWDTGVSSLGHCANYCTTVAHRAYTVGARIRRTFGAGPFSVHVQAGANHQFVQITFALIGLPPKDDTVHSVGVNNVEVGALIEMPLGKYFLVQAGPRLGLRLSQKAWTSRRYSGDWRVGIGYRFAKMSKAR